MALLEVQRGDVVRRGADVGLCERLADAIALGRAADEEMVDVSRLVVGQLDTPTTATAPTKSWKGSDDQVCPFAAWDLSRWQLRVELLVFVGRRVQDGHVQVDDPVLGQLDRVEVHVRGGRFVAVDDVPRVAS